MAKIVFVLHRKSGSSREECLEAWGGARHTTIVKTIPGLRRWVRNDVVGEPGGQVCDGIGEMWFDSDEAMQAALASPEMGAAVEDAKSFLDMEKTGLVIVREIEGAD